MTMMDHDGTTIILYCISSYVRLVEISNDSIMDFDFYAPMQLEKNLSGWEPPKLSNFLFLIFHHSKN